MKCDYLRQQVKIARHDGPYGKPHKAKFSDNLLFLAAVLFFVACMIIFIYIIFFYDLPSPNAIQTLPGGVYDAGLSAGQVKEITAGNNTIITTPTGQAIFSTDTASLYETGLNINKTLNAIPDRSISIFGSFDKLNLILSSSANTTIQITGDDNYLTLYSGRINLLIDGNNNSITTINSSIIRNITIGESNLISNKKTLG